MFLCRIWNNIDFRCLLIASYSIGISNPEITTGVLLICKENNEIKVSFLDLPRVLLYNDLYLKCQCEISL